MVRFLSTSVVCRIRREIGEVDGPARADVGEKVVDELEFRRGAVIIRKAGHLASAALQNIPRTVTDQILDNLASFIGIIGTQLRRQTQAQLQVRRRRQRRFHIAAVG
ncbi:hypothetical protein M885DRAFT_534312, partial [Pelagophyceae sp. CCMP2097]